MMSLIGKSKAVRGLVVAGALAAAGVPTYAQAEEKESCDSVFGIKGSGPASYFPGLDLELTPIPGRCYRDDGTVESIREHFKRLEKETSYSPPDSEFILGPENFSGMAFPVYKKRDGKGNMLVIKCCLDIGPEENIDCQAHEEMHAVRMLFKGSDEPYEKLGKRFGRMGYKVDFRDFDSEETALIAGILRMMELGMPVSEGYMENVSGRKEAFDKLQRYCFSQAHFWKDDLSSVLPPLPGLYKPGPIKRNP